MIALRRIGVLAGVVGAFLFVPSGAPAESDPCGDLPRDIVVDQSFVSALHDLKCESGSVNAGFTSISSSGYGHGFLDSDSQACDGKNHDVSAASKVVSKYLHTADSLLAAECGYRACKLAGTPDVASEFLATVCSGQRGGAGGKIRLVDPVKFVRVSTKKGSTVVRFAVTNTNSVAVTLVARGGPGLGTERLKVTFSDGTIRHRIDPNTKQELTVKLDYVVRPEAAERAKANLVFAIEGSGQELAADVTLMPELVCEQLPNPVDPKVLASISSLSPEKASEEGRVTATCPTGKVIVGYTSLYGDGSHQQSCGHCDLGTPSCSVVFSNAHCGDPSRGSPKQGTLSVQCAPAAGVQVVHGGLVGEGSDAAASCPPGAVIVGSQVLYGVGASGCTNREDRGQCSGGEGVLCPACPVGAASCSAHLDNTSCGGDCCANVGKRGYTSLACVHARKTGREVCRKGEVCQGAECGGYPDQVTCCHPEWK